MGTETPAYEQIMSGNAKQIQFQKPKLCEYILHKHQFCHPLRG